MIRRRNAILLTLGLLAPLALVDAPAGAIDQDLVATPTAGPTGTVITVSSASCTDPSEENAYLDVSLYVGTAPNEQIAAYGTGSTGSVTLTIPDWVDTSQAATIEASCELFSENDDEYLEYDPIAFDLEAGGGTPVQVRSYSRTSLLAGQGLVVAGSCGPDLANASVYAVVGNGTDQSGRSFDVIAGQGFADAEADGSFELPVYLSNASLGFTIEDDGTAITKISVDEEPMDIPAGDYTSFVYCEQDDDSGSSAQFLEPQLIDITGSAPTGDIDLTNVAGTPEVTLAGGSATGDVAGSFEGLSTEDLLGGFLPDPDASARSAHANRFQAARSQGAVDGTAKLVRNVGGTDRLVGDGDYVDFNATIDGNGAWQATDTAGFDTGIVIAMAISGDPLADGFLYDPQGVDIAVVEPTTTVPFVPVPAPAPLPANAVPGTPTYAG